ncbi:MAG: alpha/beta hydrolase [Hyphomicrobiaceae bacterium TMED74]|nr:alpha/beta hydrolase [Filomicrobium sp.]RPG35284.1 MAG: alpha/beta hydrolase [Hyphomicrobiaceae bacterium TMED74]
MSIPTAIGPTSNFYTSQRLRLHYLDWGNPDAPPLILQHGGMDHGRSWDPVALALKDDWHVIVPELRGHGDSQWTPDGDYTMAAYVYDFAQLIHQQNLAPVTILAHSLGGNIALRYAGTYTENVNKLVAIEGLGPSPKVLAERTQKTPAERLSEWIDRKRDLSGRQPRRYPSLKEAAARMQDKNQFLTKEMADHLTRYGVNQNEDGTYSWKFDNYLRAWPPSDMPQADLDYLWGQISCPTLLMYGEESWATNPEEDGRLTKFNNAQVEMYANAGHWVHHDRFEDFVASLKRFL